MAARLVGQRYRFHFLLFRTSDASSYEFTEFFFFFTLDEVTCNFGWRVICNKLCKRTEVIFDNFLEGCLSRKAFNFDTESGTWAILQNWPLAKYTYLWRFSTRKHQKQSSLLKNKLFIIIFGHNDAKLVRKNRAEYDQSLGPLEVRFLGQFSGLAFETRSTKLLYF